MYLGPTQAAAATDIGIQGVVGGKRGGGGFGPAWLDVYSKGGIWTAPRLSPSKKAPGIRFSVRCPFFFSPLLPPTPPSLKHRSVVSDFKERHFWWRRSWRGGGIRSTTESRGGVTWRRGEGGNLGRGIHATLQILSDTAVAWQRLHSILWTLLMFSPHILN